MFINFYIISYNFKYTIFYFTMSVFIYISVFVSAIWVFVICSGVYCTELVFF
nr:MAG TPA: hypothetical protein [Caudoviricetes sp.]